MGEIDLVAFDGETLVFVEVKTRGTSRFGEPWEFVDWQKQRRIEQVAAEYVSRYDLGRYAYRFDIVAVLSAGGSCEEIALYRNAF